VGVRSCQPLRGSGKRHACGGFCADWGFGTVDADSVYKGGLRAMARHPRRRVCIYQSGRASAANWKWVVCTVFPLSRQKNREKTGKESCGAICGCSVQRLVRLNLPCLQAQWSNQQASAQSTRHLPGVRQSGKPPSDQGRGPHSGNPMHFLSPGHWLHPARSGAHRVAHVRDYADSWEIARGYCSGGIIRLAHLPKPPHPFPTHTQKGWQTTAPAQPQPRLKAGSWQPEARPRFALPPRRSLSFFRAQHSR